MAKIKEKKQVESDIITIEDVRKKILDLDGLQKICENRIETLVADHNNYLLELKKIKDQKDILQSLFTK